MCDTCERHKIPESSMTTWFMDRWGRHVNYASYIFRHKWYVFIAGCKLGVPVLAALHDLSKLHPCEWNPYARHFYNTDGTKRTWRGKDGFYEDVPDEKEFDRAWLHHIQHNKHHPQYWIKIRGAHCGCAQIYKPHPLISAQYGRYPERTDVLLQDDGYATCLSCNTRITHDKLDMGVREIPMRYRLEMLADWIGAGAAQGTPDTLAWYTARGRNHIFGPLTRRWIEEQLHYVGDA